jgi:hypothetical protein
VNQIQQPGSERRRRDLWRTDVTLRAALLRPGLADIPVRVRNLSSAGFMAESFEPLAPGERVVLSLSGVGPLSAEIRWNTGFWVGGMFDFELSARELRLADSAPPAEE